MTNNTNYSIDFYSFKTGEYIYTDCDNTSWFGGKLMLRFPYLFVSNEPEFESLENPEVWFVVKQNNCMNGIDQADSDILNLEEQILTIEAVESRQKTFVYPNPFENYFVVESKMDDEIKVSTINGKNVFIKSINAGKSIIDTKNLEKGIYLVELRHQSITLKLIKL